MTDLRTAQNAILKETPILGKESVPLLDALNRVLACDVAAIEDLPVADVSALDGYALCQGSPESGSDDTEAGLRIIAEASAGSPCRLKVTPGTAVRIMTGALIPQGADRVIKLEHTREKEGRVFCLKPPLSGQGIRFQGESFKKGETVLTAGTCLSPLEIGGLAGLRRPWVTVHRKPVVAVISTGSELADFHDPAVPVQGHELQSLRPGGPGHRFRRPSPSARAWSRTGWKTLPRHCPRAGHADVVLTSGGTSKGRYDLTRKAFEAVGVRIRFSNQAKKKGKPTIFGTRGNQMVFALPGNPYATMLSFDQLVRPALLKMMGHQDLFSSQGRPEKDFSRVDTFSCGQQGMTSTLWAPSVLLGKRTPKTSGTAAAPPPCKAAG